MITLVLDGYNVIHAVPQLARQLDRSLEAARDALVSLCREYRAARGDIERLYVIFDGDEAYAGGPHGEHGGVTVLFTPRSEEADERILQLIRADGGRSRFVIVSNDTYIFNNARVHGARVIPVQEFYGKIRPARTTRSNPFAAADEMTLSSDDAQRITEEYRTCLDRKTEHPKPPDSSR